MSDPSRRRSGTGEKETKQSKDLNDKDDKEEKKSEEKQKTQGKESEKKESSDFGLREFLILYDDRELVIHALKAILRFFVRLFKAFRFKFKGFCLYLGCPDPACVGMMQGWLFSMNIPHRAYYFSWELDAEGEVRIRIVPLVVIFLILRLFLCQVLFRTGTNHLNQS